MAEEEIGVRIAAKTAGLSDGLNQATVGIKQAVTQIQGHFSGLSSAVSNLKAPFLAIGALFASGSVIKSAVDATTKWTGENMKLARSLGITTEQASVLNVAIGDIYSSTDEYLKAAGMMTRQINTGGEGFKRLGIDIRDAQGHLKPTGPLMQEVLTKLNGITQGTARNAAGMAIFGRGWGDASKLLRLNAEVMEEARKKAEKLNLITGGDAVDAQMKYKAAMNDSEDSVLGLKVMLGQQFLPILTEFNRQVGEDGPGAVEGLGIAIKSLASVFGLVKAVVADLGAVIGGVVGGAIAWFGGLASIVNRIVHGDFKGAAQAAKQIGTDLKNEFAATTEVIADNNRKLAESWANIWEAKKKGGATKVEKQGDKDFDPSKGKDKGDQRLKEWQAQLRILQDANAKLQMEDGKYYEMTLAEERNFWQKKLEVVGLSEKERIALTIKVKDLERGIRKEGFDANLAELHAAEAAAVNDLQVKRDLVLKEVALYRDGTKEQIDARKKLADVDAEIAKQRQALNMLMVSAERDHQLNLLALDEQAAQHRFDMGQSTQEQLLEQQRAFATQRFQIEENELIEELAAGDLTLEKEAELNNKKVALFEEYQLKIKGLKNQAAVEDRALMADMFVPMRQAWDSAMMGMLGGTMRLSDGLRSIWAGMGKVLDQMVTRMVTSWITGENTKSMATQFATIKRVGLESWATIKSVAMKVWEGIQWITIEGWKAAAGAYAAIVSIPYVGPFLAPVAAGVALAAVIGMVGKLSSAKGGWGNIPQDQIAQVHKGEMVLPAEYAEKVRNMTEGGGAKGDTYHVTIQALDSQSFESALARNPGALQKVGAAMARNRRTAGGFA